MVNADEHKKLLAQVAELEKNSVNYFNVEKEFFLIDSDNLPQVRPRLNDFIDRQDIRSMDFDSDNPSRVRSRLYGYSIQRTGIYEEDNLTAETIAGLDGRGCYVYVEVKDGNIMIKQDLNGSWGIYLFRHGNYFALSNSFFRLVDHVKFKYPLTVNRDYCHHLLTNSLVSHAYLESAINEIRLVERNAIIHIDIGKKKLEIELINYREHTVPLDSEEGISTLDRWAEFWGDVLRGVAQNTNFLQAHLSGGFDTRMALVSLLHSGIDLSKIRIHSLKSEYHTYPEDYAIAFQIAEHYNFKLNQDFPTQQAFCNYSLNDVFNLDFYSRQTVHKSWAILKSRKSINKIYSLSGYGGELIRGNWLRFGSLERFRQSEIRRDSYSRPLSQEIAYFREKILESTFDAIRDKYKIEDENSLWFAQYLYQETRCRHHFGKFTLGKYFGNEIVLSPAIAPEIRTVRLETPECPDPKLLMALLFVRYEPDLLTFPFDSKRFIAPETIEYAKKINERFPRRMIKDKADKGVFHLQPKDLQAEKIIAAGKNNPSISMDLTKTCFKAMFDSSRTYGLFTAYFDEELYRYATVHIDYIIGVIGVTRVLEDVEISQRNHSPYQDLKRFLEQDFAKIHKVSRTPDKFQPYLTARVDIQLMSTTGDFEIFSVSDDKAKVSKPSWFQKNGIGYQLNSYAGELDFTAKATTDGQIKLWLRGVWVPDPKDKSKLIPYWIDYTKLTVNGETIFDTITPAWCNKPYSYNFKAKTNEEIKIQVEWLPHRSDT